MIAMVNFGGIARLQLIPPSIPKAANRKSPDFIKKTPVRTIVGKAKEAKPRLG
jgi:hypothetical protein